MYDVSTFLLLFKYLLNVRLWLQYPETASFLTEEDRRVVSIMLKEDQQGMPKHFEWKFVIQTLADYKTYVLVGIYLGTLHENPKKLLSSISLQDYSFLRMRLRYSHLSLSTRSVSLLQTHNFSASHPSLLVVSQQSCLVSILTN